MKSLKIVLAVLAYAGYALFSFAVAAGAALWTAPRANFEYFFFLAFTMFYLLLYAGILHFFKSARRGKFRIIKIFTGLAVFGLLSAAMLIPGYSGRQDAPTSENIKFWSLSTGSTLSYIHVGANSATEKKTTPILFLHGGPGIPDLLGDSRYFGQLANEGYDIYVYAQLGSGLSTRLEDQNQYSLERDAEDLEEIRRQIGTEKIILIGHSYGAKVIARYMVDHGEHVVQAAFLSPGAMDPRDHSDATLTNRLTPTQKWRLYRHLLHPRSLFVYGLLQFRPDVARSFASDNEMDRRFDAVYAATEPALHCSDYKGQPKLSGLGFYANQTPQSLTSQTDFDPRELLTKRKFALPVLITKGGCDYLSWESAQDYRRVFPNSKLVYLPETGHNLYQDQPEAFLDILREFLATGTQNIKGYDKESPPDDYQAN